MTVFGAVEQDGHERILFAQDAESGLKAIIAVHSTVLGPALGGTRFYPYEREEDALADALRLSRAMTRKNAAAGLDHGGGKGVIIGDPRAIKSEGLLRAYGRAVESLGGAYLTAEDVGTTTADMEVIARETRYVTGMAREAGGSGDPSPTTALGLMAAMRGVARSLWGSTDLTGRHVAVQGVGKVGGAFARMLAGAGARLTIADVNVEAVESLARETGAAVADPASIHAVDCDVFAPCALGGALNPETVPELRCAAIVGSANNQLASDGIAADLAIPRHPLRARLHRERRRGHQPRRGGRPRVPPGARQPARPRHRGDRRAAARPRPGARQHAPRRGDRARRPAHPRSREPARRVRPLGLGSPLAARLL